MEKKIIDVNHIEIEYIGASEKRNDNVLGRYDLLKHFLLLKINEKPYLVSVTMVNDEFIFNDFCPCSLYTCLSDTDAKKINDFVENGIINKSIKKPVEWLNGNNDKLGDRFSKEHYSGYNFAESFFNSLRNEFKEFLKAEILQLISEKEKIQTKYK